MLAETSFRIIPGPDGMPGVTLNNCLVRLVAPQIVENRMNEGAVIDLEDVNLIKKTNEQLCPDETYAVLVTFTHFNTITEEARKRMASADFVKRSLGKALLVHNIAAKLIAEFYLRVNKPEMPTRVFTDREKAMTWLRELVVKG